jgi:hypothetical protein
MAGGPLAPGLDPGLDPAIHAVPFGEIACEHKGNKSLYESAEFRHSVNNLPSSEWGQ